MTIPDLSDFKGNCRHDGDWVWVEDKWYRCASCGYTSWGIPGQWLPDVSEMVDLTP